MKDKDLAIIAGLAVAGFAAYKLTGKTTDENGGQSSGGGTIIDFGSFFDTVKDGAEKAGSTVTNLIGSGGGGFGGGLVPPVFDPSANNAGGGGFDLNQFLIDLWSQTTGVDGNDDGEGGNFNFDEWTSGLFDDFDRNRGGTTWKENIDSVSNLFTEALIPAGLVGLGGALSLKIAPPIAGAVSAGLKPVLTGAGSGIGAAANATGRAAGSIITTASRGITGGASMLGRGAAGVAQVGGAALGSPIGAGVAALGSGIAAGLLFNQTPLGQDLLERSAANGAETARNTAAGTAKGLEKAIGTALGWNVAQVNKTAVDNAFKGTDLNYNEVSAMVKAGMSPADILDTLPKKKNPSETAPVQSSALRPR